MSMSSPVRLSLPAPPPRPHDVPHEKGWGDGFWDASLRSRSARGFATSRSHTLRHSWPQRGAFETGCSLYLMSAPISGGSRMRGPPSGLGQWVAPPKVPDTLSKGARARQRGGETAPLWRRIGPSGQKRSGGGGLAPVCAQILVPNVQYRDFGAAFCTRVCTRSEGMCLRWPPNRDCTRCVWPPQEEPEGYEK